MYNLGSYNQQSGNTNNAYYKYVAGNNFNTTQSQTQLKDFEIVSKLGEGSFSQVFQVKRKSDGLIYAMKKVKMGLLKEKEKENALNEVRILASLTDEYIVGYKEAFIDEPSQLLCVVMEYASDGDLQAKINGHKKAKTYFAESEVWKALIHMSKGLQTLHEMKILHRDLKCANVFLYGDGAYKLGDLNVSKVAKKGLVYTQTGTPYYASPEVWRDQPYDTKSDIWSLGCVLYEMCSLQPPFRANDMEGLYKKVQKGVFERIPARYSSDLQTVLSSLLKVSPIQRPTCEQILSNPLVLKQQQQQGIPSTGNQTNNQANQGKKLLKKPSKQELLSTIVLPKNLGMLKGKLPKANYKKAESIDDIEHNYEQDDDDEKEELKYQMKKTNRIASAGAKRIQPISSIGGGVLPRKTINSNGSVAGSNITSAVNAGGAIRPPSAQNRPTINQPSSQLLQKQQGQEQQQQQQQQQPLQQNRLSQQRQSQLANGYNDQGSNNNNTNSIADSVKPRPKIMQRPASGGIGYNYNDYGRNNGQQQYNYNNINQSNARQQPSSAYKVNTPVQQMPLGRPRPPSAQHPLQSQLPDNANNNYGINQPKNDRLSNYLNEQQSSAVSNSNINKGNQYINPYRPVVDRYDMPVQPTRLQQNRIQSSNINNPTASRNLLSSQQQQQQQYLLNQKQQGVYNRYSNVSQSQNNNGLSNVVNKNQELNSKLAVKERALLGGGAGGGVSQSVNANPLGNYNNRQLLSQQQQQLNGISRIQSEQNGIGVSKQQRIQSSRPYQQQQQQLQQPQQLYNARVPGYNNPQVQAAMPAGNAPKAYDPADYAYAGRRQAQGNGAVAPLLANRYGQVQQSNPIKQAPVQPTQQVGRPNWWG